MKNTIKTAAILLIALFSFTFMSCEKEDLTIPEPIEEVTDITDGLNMSDRYIIDLKTSDNGNSMGISEGYFHTTLMYISETNVEPGNTPWYKNIDEEVTLYSEDRGVDMIETYIKPRYIIEDDKIYQLREIRIYMRERFMGAISSLSVKQIQEGIITTHDTLSIYNPGGSNYPSILYEEEFIYIGEI